LDDILTVDLKLPIFLVIFLQISSFGGLSADHSKVQNRSATDEIIFQKKSNRFRKTNREQYCVNSLILECILDKNAMLKHEHKKLRRMAVAAALQIVSEKQIVWVALRDAMPLQKGDAAKV